MSLRTIATLAFPEVMSLDVTGPMQVFASANVERTRQGLPECYRLLLLGQHPVPVATSCGIRLCVDACWQDVPPATLDTLLVPGGAGVEAQCRNAALLAWLSARRNMRRASPEPLRERRRPC